MDTSETALVRSLLEALLKRLQVDNGAPPADETKAAAGSRNVAKIAPGEAAGTAAACTLHPGLEKFVVSKECSSDSAPKTCYIEPDRVCVNSGACEMRGY
jgi:hypothetical protein